MEPQRARMPGIVDRHVHLGLVDSSQLRDSSVVEVHDLGWSPDAALRWRREGIGGVVVRIAGQFLTPVGGYPKGRSWAPDGAIREIAGVGGALAAVVSAVVQRFDAIKIVLHAGYPPFAEHALTALVGGAHQSGLQVVAHVEGPARRSSRSPPASTSWRTCRGRSGSTTP